MKQNVVYARLNKITKNDRYSPDSNCQHALNDHVKQMTQRLTCNSIST